MTNVLAVCNNKGGVLKTSITTNLAGVLSKQGKKVLIIDTDSQGNASVVFGINPDDLEVTIANVIFDGTDVNEAIINATENIDILPSNDELAVFTVEVINNKENYSNPFFIFKPIVDSLRGKYDYILIDSAPELGLVSTNSLVAADSVLIPYQPETFSSRGLVKLINYIKGTVHQLNPNLKVEGIISTLVDNRTFIHKYFIEECKSLCNQHGIKFFDTSIPRSIQFENSVSIDHLPATLNSSFANSLVVQAYEELNKEMNGVVTEK